jgi:hypothetical protein
VGEDAAGITDRAPPEGELILYRTANDAVRVEVPST